MNQSNIIDLLKIFGLAGLYVGMAAVFLIYVAPNGVVSVVWPPSGLALAVLLIGGRRYAYGVLLGAFLANGLINHAWLQAAPIAMGNTLEALLGAWLLTRTGQFDRSVQSLRDYMKLVFWAGFVACSVAAVNGPTVLLISGFIDRTAYLENILHWWMGDMLGVVLITPLILVFWHNKIDRHDLLRWREVLALLGGTFLVGQVVFLGWFGETLGLIAKGYWMFLLVTWVASRFGKRATMLVLLVSAAQGLLGAYQGIGYFDHDVAETGLTNYWFYMMILSVVGMALATYFSERSQAEGRALANERKFRAIIDASPVPQALNDEQGNITFLNPAFIQTFGYTLQDIPSLADWWPKAYPDPVYRKGVQDTWQVGMEQAKFTGEPFKSLELIIRCKDGMVRTVLVSAASIGAGLSSEHLVVLYDMTERKAAEEEIYSLAYYDILTKLPNRRLLQDRFGMALVLSERSGNYGVVLFLDMDKFKTLNDTLGHGYGDLLLIEVAVRIKACVREIDTVARMGGDEFVVLIEEVSSDAEEATQKAAHIAEKIRGSLVQPYILEGHEQHSSPSIGVCLYRGRSESVESLLKHADLAMYQAKTAGRNTVCFFDPVMQHEAEGRAALEADLRRAVALHQLHLYYQIQLDNEHRPLGAEALLRWTHPTRGMVSPAQFIPLAEETLLIIEIGHWVLESACQQLKLWEQHERTRDLTIAVNVSAQQFAMPDFVGQVAAVLRKHRVNPSRLKLELTESVVLDDVQGTVAIMHALKGLGVGLSMDDFGTGYSSLSYLKILPLDQLKIDQSFVRDITTDPNDAVLVQTIIDMARNFRLNVIAEGVETEAQLAFLKQHGCMAYQGYLFSKPVLIEEFETLL
ncbi:MAG: EAL domain-containing protein [Gallionella sp.]